MKHLEHKSDEEGVGGVQSGEKEDQWRLYYSVQFLKMRL